MATDSSTMTPDAPSPPPPPPPPKDSGSQQRADMLGSRNSTPEGVEPSDPMPAHEAPRQPNDIKQQQPQQDQARSEHNQDGQTRNAADNKIVDEPPNDAHVETNSSTDSELDDTETEAASYDTLPGGPEQATPPDKTDSSTDHEQDASILEETPSLETQSDATTPPDGSGLGDVTDQGADGTSSVETQDAPAEDETQKHLDKPETPSQEVEKFDAGSFRDPEKAQEHFDRHGADFGSLSREDYTQVTQNFLKEAQEKNFPAWIDTTGRIRIMDPPTNTFGVYDSDRTLVNCFKPTSRTFMERNSPDWGAPVKWT